MFRLLNVRLAAAVLAGLAFGAGGGFALGAAVGVSVPNEKAAALDRLVASPTTDSNTEQVPAPDFQSRAIPAQMLGPDVPVPISPSVLRPQNGWLVSDGKTLVAVYTGTAGDEPSVGRVVIVRQDLVAGEQTLQTVDAGPSGALTIEDAPLGSSVETAAQTGTIGLRTPDGERFTLDLAQGKVSQDAHGSSVP